MIDVNQSTFDTEVIDASYDLPVLVDFWAPWCSPCQVLGPLLERIEREAPGRFKLAKVDLDENPALAAAWQVRSIPTVIAFRAGAPIDRFLGALPETRIRTFIDAIVPRPGEALLAQARLWLAAGESERAASALCTALALNPSMDKVRAAYVGILLQLGRVDAAALAFAPLADRADRDLYIAALSLLIDTKQAVRDQRDERPLRHAVEVSPTDPQARWRLAQWLIAAGRWQAAMDELLALVRIDRTYGNDIGRRGLLAAFELCRDEALVRDYRRRLASGLY